MKARVWRHDAVAKTDVPGEAAELALGLDVPMAPAAGVPVPPPPEPQPAPEVIKEIEPPPVEPVSLPVVEVVAVPAVETSPRPVPAPAPREAVTATPSPVTPPPQPLPQPPTPEKPPALVASFAGVKAEKARRVVYMVDVSGVMVPTLPFVIAELERCVARLTPDQEFQVVLFRDPLVGEGDEPLPDPPLLDTLLDHARWIGQVNGVGRPGMLAATPENKARLGPLTRGVSASGPSNPLTGLRIALTLKPEVVFLLTRGIKRSDTTWGSGEEATLEALDRANPKDASGARATTIKTIQFVSKDPNGLMDAIAREHGGGESTVVTIEDLKKSSDQSVKSTKPVRGR
ncbi:MAG: hypothetical protein AABZ53_06300 [Planctomycetota bacterium]